jgi:hypothetical protein
MHDAQYLPNRHGEKGDDWYPGEINPRPANIDVGDQARITDGQGWEIIGTVEQMEEDLQAGSVVVWVPQPPAERLP